ncbi:MAG: hypothetical protein K6U89_14660 [Chloroflexi bacterium]|nr:hypothetical protein [Chloroflexota bacterium]
MINTTVSNNGAGNNAGEIEHSAGSFSVLNSTIRHNTSHGITFGSATAVIKNTIVANNANRNCLISATPTSQGCNLSSDATCTFFTASGDQTSVDPQLAPLQDNGGSTPTRALAMTSPAVDGGRNSGCTTTD